MNNDNDSNNGACCRCQAGWLWRRDRTTKATWTTAVSKFSLVSWDDLSRVTDAYWLLLTWRGLVLSALVFLMYYCFIYLSRQHMMLCSQEYIQRLLLTGHLANVICLRNSQLGSGCSWCTAIFRHQLYVWVNCSWNCQNNICSELNC